jgi:serine phosphatase RsbU (regulator of sigma subunit)
LKYFIALLVLFLALLAHSKELPTDFKEIKLTGNDISFLIDEGRRYEIESVPFQDFRKYQKETPNFGFLNGTLWLKIHPDFYSKESIILELKNPNLDRIHLYVKKEEGYVLQAVTGDEYRYKQRERDHRFFQFAISGHEDVLIKIENNGDQLYVPISILSEKAISKRDYADQYTIGIYYGIILFVFILNLFIFIVIKERANLYYLLYILGLIFLQLALGGFGFEYLWSNSPFVANHSLPFLATISVLFLVFFVQSFLGTKQNLPKFNKVFNGFVVLLIVNCFFSILPAEWFYRLSILLVNGITLILNILILPVTFILVRRNFKPARFFLAAFIVLILSVFGFVLRNFGIAPSNFFTDYSLQIGSAVEVILLSFAVVDRFKMFKEEAFSRLQEMNDMKSRQNEELEIQVKDRTKEVIHQKELVEEKNKEIIDSINYSKRIQSAIIPSVETFKSKFKDAFVLFQPKDIVSGDFYWMGESVLRDENGEDLKCTIFSVGDCTGHGVPGAIISVLGLRTLMATNNHPDICNTGDILNYLNKEISQLFNSNLSEVQIRDGMDIAICAYHEESKRLFFSGAKNGLYILRNGEIIEFKGEKHVIGSHDESYSFSYQTIEMKSGDRVYLTSDGYADQFGGPAGKKMKPILLRTEIQNSAQLNMSDQGKALGYFFNNWKGDTYEQTDDVCVIGIEI